MKLIGKMLTSAAVAAAAGMLVPVTGHARPAGDCPADQREAGASSCGQIHENSR